jgi:hypothetical protein
MSMELSPTIEDIDVEIRDSLGALPSGHGCKLKGRIRQVVPWADDTAKRRSDLVLPSIDWN